MCQCRTQTWDLSCQRWRFWSSQAGWQILQSNCFLSQSKRFYSEYTTLRWISVFSTCIVIVCLLHEPVLSPWPELWHNWSCRVQSSGRDHPLLHCRRLSQEQGINIARKSVRYLNFQLNPSQEPGLKLTRIVVIWNHPTVDCIEMTWSQMWQFYRLTYLFQVTVVALSAI